MTEATDDVPEQSEQLDQIQEEDSLLDRGTEDILDEGYSPAERYSAAERFGNTAEEQSAGETLDQRLAQEEPDLQVGGDDQEDVDDGEVGSSRAGRLVDPDEGSGPDIDSEMVGSDVGIDGAGASAEEAAVYIVSDFDYDE
jgi:Family of unknown function (DUF5709)